jgi:cobalamin biosynthesis Mg chelatase CobN
MLSRLLGVDSSTVSYSAMRRIDVILHASSTFCDTFSLCFDLILRHVAMILFDINNSLVCINWFCRQ